MAVSTQVAPAQVHRLSLMAAGVGAVAAWAAAALGRVDPVRAGSDGDVVNGSDNALVQHRTLVHNNHANVNDPANDDVVDGLFGLSDNNGAAVAGQSTGGGVGVKGYVGPIPMPNTLSTGFGVYGQGPTAGVKGVSTTGPGVIADGYTYGVRATNSSEDPDAAAVKGRGLNIGVQGQATLTGRGPSAPSHVGVYGWASEDGDLAPAATGVYGESDTGVGVHAHAPFAIALKVDGKVHLSRSGKATIAINKGSVVVALAGVTTDSMIFAVLAKNVSAHFVRAVVPGSGSFTIYLNKAVSASTPVSWFVLD